MSLPWDDTLAVIMAGGRGERMRASGQALPKPLVPVAGAPLILRALHQLLRFGLPRAVVATPAGCPELGRWVEEIGVPTAAGGGMDLLLFEEATPLGTLGAVAEVARGAGAALVINADNLCALDLRAFVDAHRQRGALMTVASHLDRRRLPYAEIATDGDRIVRYEEKPWITTRVSSGLYVLDRRAIARMDPGARLDAPQLVQRLLGDGARVFAFDHDAPWMDVNDATALPAAQALIAAHRGAFETFAPRPHQEVVGALIEGPGGVLLERRPPTAAAHPSVWDTPGGKIEAGERPEDALARELEEELGVGLIRAEAIATFDDVCTASRRIIRHHAFRCQLDGEPRAREGQTLRWLCDKDLYSQDDISPIVERTRAWGGSL